MFIQLFILITNSNSLEWWGIFWSAFSGITTLLATLVALGVALWEIKFKYKRKLKIRLGHGIVMNDNKYYLCINLTNIGHNPIKVNKIYFKLNKRELVIIKPNHNFNDITLPYTLNSGETITDIELHDVIAKNFEDAMARNEICKNEKIIICANDTMDKKYSYDTKIKYKNFII